MIARRGRAVCCVLGLIVAFCPTLLGQAYPTNNVFFRIAMVESQYGRGTVFSIDVDQREYWITAKHILTGAEHPPYGTVDTTKPVTLKVLDPGAESEQWLTVTFSVIDPGADIDTVALAPQHLLLSDPLPAVSFENAHIMMGGDCSFLGFPFGGGWRATINGKGYWMPYVKRCSISSIPGNNVVILDGINNHGFSGGPVLYETGPNQKLVAVISGYSLEPAEVVSSSQKRKRPAPAKEKHRSHANVNSGFIIAYFIDPTIAAIRKNPIGPLRTAMPK